MLIEAWNDAGWIDRPRRVGDRIGRLIGAPAGSVVIGDTLSIKMYQALAAALELRPDRRTVLTDNGNFPSDLYIAEGLLASLARGHELRVVAPDEIANAIDDSVAAVMLTEVDYRTGRRHDMRDLTSRSHAAGAIAIWDLAHSAGAIPVDVSEVDADLAAGCTYKYLNGGPGAPAFIYVAPRLAEQVRPALAGWMGHAAPFAFEQGYRAAPSIDRMRVGSPPILALAALDAALDVWEGVSTAEVYRASQALSERFISEVEQRCPNLLLASPRDPDRRGSQVAFRHAEGYAIMQALIAERVIGDFRAPDILRFGFTPLYLDEAEVARAALLLSDIVNEERWRAPAFQARKMVT